MPDKTTTESSTATAVAETPMLKFVQFTKVDAAKREVSGIVTAEQPDKDFEICDYDGSKPYYKKWSEEFRKSTDGASLGNLREMHGLSAVGKAIDLQFRDEEKEIVMTFKVVDDDAWKKVEERVYTGFSQGGRKVGESIQDKVYKNCQRYVANPTEVSLVDNPCLPAAHFMYVKTDGSVEMRKFLKTELPETDRIASLEAKVEELTKAAKPASEKVIPISKPAVTKLIAGQDLPSTAFAYVGSLEKTETWKFPVHDAKHVRKSFADFHGEAKWMPRVAKVAAKAKLVASGKEFGIDLDKERSKVKAIADDIRTSARVYVNANRSVIKSAALLSLDMDLGKLAKGMFEVSRLSVAIEELAWLFYGVVSEQEFELDTESELPEMLGENISSLTETLLQMVDEETRELLAHVKEHVA